ncbi:MAG: nitroreductase family deazaflavin-dependent oxidoreductase [Candidatus Limnocylindria bacterium]
MTPAEFLGAHAADGICHLQTVGRTSGRPRTIEIWFATDGERIYVLAGGRDRAHWVRNLRAEPRVRVRIGGRTIHGTARVIDAEAREPLARRLLAAKYQGWSEGAALSSWAASSLPVEIVLES